MRALLVVLLIALPLASASGQALTLERAITLALERNERARATHEQIAAAKARVERARAALFPDVTLSGTYTRRQEDVTSESRGRTVVIQSANAFAAELAVSSTVLDARAFPLIRQARLEAASAELAGADARRRVAFEAADAFVAALSAEQAAAAARHRVAVAAQTLEDTRARVRAELVGSNDATRAEVEAVAAARDLIRAEADVATTRLVLGNVLASDVTGPLAPLEAPGGGALDVEGLVREATARREDVASRERHVEALRASAEEPGLRLIPSLELSAHVDATTESGFGDRTVDWFVQARMTWTAWDGGARAAEKDERSALVRSGELDVAAARRMVALEVRTAATLIAAARRTLAESERGVALARKSAEESAVLYRRGLAPALSLIDANARLFDAELSVVRERLSLAMASLQLRASLGLMPVEVAR